MLNFTQARLIAAATLLLLLAAPAASYAQFPGASELETWSDDSLKHQIKAKFKGMEGEFVKLETADGTVRKIPYNKLSLSSQLKVKKITDPRSFDAPPLPSTYSAPPVPESPFTPDDSIDKFLETFTQQLKDGHAEVLWHAMPPQAQADLEGLIIANAESLGTSSFKHMQVVLPDLHTIVRDKRTFIVNSPRIAAIPALAKGLNQVLPAIEPVIGVLTKSTTWNSENFKQGKVGPWFMLFAKDAISAGNTAMANMRTLFPAGSFPTVEDLANYKIIEKTADSATVEFVISKKKNTVKFKKVDGFWLADWEEQFFEELAKARKEAESMSPSARDQVKSDLRMQLTLLNGFLGPLAKAKTQQEFNLVFDPIADGLIKALQQAVQQAQQGSQPGMPGMPAQPGMESSSDGSSLSGGANRPRKGLSGLGGSQ